MIANGLVTAQKTVDAIVGTFIVGCIYGVFVAPFILAVLGLECTWAKRRAAPRP